MNKFKTAIQKRQNAIAMWTAATVILGATALTSGVAGAAAISATFTSVQSSLVTELGYGVALVVALLLIGLGVRMLIKWSKHGVHSA